MREVSQMQMRHSLRLRIFTLVFLGLGFFINAQEQDLRLRTAVAVSTDLPFGFDGELELQQRFKENISRYDASMLTLGLGYGILKGLKAEIGYRFTVEQDSRLELEPKHRFNADLRYKKTLFDVDLKVRTRLQLGYDEKLFGANYYKNSFVSRNAFEAGYHIKQTRFSPYMSYELFFSLNELDNSAFSKTRLTGGCGVSLTKASDLDVYYMFENEFNVYKPEDSYILGISYSYSF